MSTFKASIVIPLFNEEANIDHLIKMLVNTNAFKINYCQLVLVNNGSKDKTGELIDYHHKQYPAQIKCIHIKDNINYGG
ncbi:MAG: glycosyltransferase, partial [Gammaproteobacteria bacterium]